MTKNHLGHALIVLGFVIGASISAYGLAFGGHHGPEIDPNLAVSGLTLLVGTLAVLRVRRKK